MAQVSTASAAAAKGVVDDDDIGARIARLGLPAKPMIMGKTTADTNCLHEGYCYCNIYTTMLDRGPDQPMLPDSPEPDNRKGYFPEKRGVALPLGTGIGRIGNDLKMGGVVNGISKNAKKISLQEYASKRALANGKAKESSKSPVAGVKRYWLTFSRCAMLLFYQY